jgi:excisionase family DNA binding protein
MTDKPWSVSELAKAAGINASYVRKLCQAGTLAGAYLVGKTWVIPREVGDQWLASRRGKWEKF